MDQKDILKIRDHNDEEKPVPFLKVFVETIQILLVHHNLFIMLNIPTIKNDN